MKQVLVAERYELRLEWSGSREQGTASYTSYGREYRISVEGKADLEGTASVRFRGLPSLHNPEELLIAAASSCHMLAYLALCARKGVHVVAYEDRATGALTLNADGSGMISEIVLTPNVTIANDSDETVALELHKTAHEQCFIANSCSVPITHRPVVRRSMEA